jgi:hypothetical protein
MVTLRIGVLLGAVLLLACGKRPVVDSPAAHEERPPANATASLEPVRLDSECVVLAALREVGVKEEGCANCGPRVETYLSSVHLTKGYPWCSSFCHWSFRQCGNILKPERAFAAAAQFATDHEVFRKGQLLADEEASIGHPMRRISEDGMTFCLWYANLNRIGHVGLITGEDEKYLWTVEGNTSESGSREGTTVKRRKRLKSTIWTINDWRP